MMGKKKEISWQILKGICVIAVLLIHCRTGAEFSAHNWNFWYWFSLRQIVDFAVPLFFFASAYFVNKNIVKENFSTYVKRRLKKLIVPFYIWSTIYTVINVLLDLLTHTNIDVKSTMINWITGRVGTPFYFVLVLIQFTLLLPIIVKLSEKRKKYIIGVAIGIWYLIIYIFVLTKKNLFSGYETIFLTWLIMYYAGFLCRENNSKGFGTCAQRWMIMICMLLVTFGEGILLYKLGVDVGVAVSQTRISSMLWSLSLANLFLYYKEKVNICSNKCINVVSYIGNNSFGIFFIHCLLRKASNYIIPYIPVANDLLPLYQLLQFGIMLIGSIVIIWILKKIFKEKASQIFGV